jgi:hypothetical protein
MGYTLIQKRTPPSELLVCNLKYANKTNFTHMTTIFETYIVCDTEDAYIASGTKLKTKYVYAPMTKIVIFSLCFASLRHNSTLNSLQQSQIPFLGPQSLEIYLGVLS